MGEIRVLHVDDSAVIRGIVSKLLEQDKDVKIVGSASNGEMGVSLYKREHPDVVLMDIEMPLKDGISALKDIMAFDPKARVIMCSTLTVDNGEMTMQAMKIGAVDYIPKPTSNSEINSSEDFREKLLRLVRSIGKRASTLEHQSKQSGIVAGMPVPTGEIKLKPAPLPHWKPGVIAVGSSTGGPAALYEFLRGLKGVQTPIVVTQHMPATFTTLLAKHITEQTGIECVEGAEGMVVQPGKILLAPGGKHMEFIKRPEGTLQVRITDGPQENFCKPSVDVMYRSLHTCLGGRVLCAILTGMGSDGCKEAQKIVEHGGFCIAQNQDTSVVWGMPGAVANAGICSAVLPLKDMADWIKKHVNTGGVKS